MSTRQQPVHIAETPRGGGDVGHAAGLDTREDDDAAQPLAALGTAHAAAGAEAHGDIDMGDDACGSVVPDVHVAEGSGQTTGVVVGAAAENTAADGAGDPVGTASGSGSEGEERGEDEGDSEDTRADETAGEGGSGLVPALTEAAPGEVQGVKMTAVGDDAESEAAVVEAVLMTLKGEIEEAEVVKNATVEVAAPASPAVTTAEQESREDVRRSVDEATEAASLGSVAAAAASKEAKLPTPVSNDDAEEKSSSTSVAIMAQLEAVAEKVARRQMLTAEDVSVLTRAREMEKTRNANAHRADDKASREGTVAGGGGGRQGEAVKSDLVSLAEREWTQHQVESYVDFTLDTIVTEAMEMERRDLREALQDAMLAGARGAKVLCILLDFAVELGVPSSDPFVTMARQILALSSLADVARKAAKGGDPAQMERAMTATATEVRVARKLSKVPTGGQLASEALAWLAAEPHVASRRASSARSATHPRPTSVTTVRSASLADPCSPEPPPGRPRRPVSARVPTAGAPLAPRFRPSSAQPAHTGQTGSIRPRPTSARPAHTVRPQSRQRPASVRSGERSGVPGLAAARARLLQARVALECRLVESAVEASMGSAATTKQSAQSADRVALMALLRRADDLDERNVCTVVDRLRAMEAEKRVAEWRRVKAAEARKLRRAQKAEQTARVVSVDVRYTHKEERNVIKYEEWARRKARVLPRAPPKPEEARRQAVEEALRKEEELREKNRQAMAAWKAMKVVEEAERRRLAAEDRRKLDAEMAMRRLENEMWMKHHRFHEPCELYVTPPTRALYSNYDTW